MAESAESAPLEEEIVAHASQSNRRWSVSRPEFIPAAEPDLSGNELRYLRECIESGWVSSLGPFVSEFEKQFARFTGNEFCLTTCNGTAALHLTLAALDLRQGDEVIVPDLTFAATANAVIYCGATPVLVDVARSHLGLDPERVRDKISPRTRAILAVHLYGHPCDMQPLAELAREHDLKLIEDAAEAHGARYRGHLVGALGEVSCFSFFGNKIITTGEGGAVCTNDPDLHARMSLLRDHGMTKKYWHEVVGFNYRLTNMQAAVGLAQLERVDEMIVQKRRNYELYNQCIQRSDVEVLSECDWAFSVFWAVNILLGKDFPCSRDELLEGLANERIEARPLFYPLHQMPPYRRYVEPDDSFPVATEVSERGLSLPSASSLSESAIRRVASTIDQLAEV